MIYDFRFMNGLRGDEIERAKSQFSGHRSRRRGVRMGETWRETTHPTDIIVPNLS